MDPFDKHRADPDDLAERERRFVDLAREAVDANAFTLAAFNPASASWDGIAAAELRSAPEPVRARAYEVASQLTWAATATRVWAGHVRAFNATVEGLRVERQQVPVEVERFIASAGWYSLPVFDQDAIRERRREELLEELCRRWRDAYERHVQDGSRDVAGMLEHGPTWGNVDLARRAGAFPAGSPILSFFTADWEAAVAPDEALRLAGRISTPGYRPDEKEIRALHHLLERHADDERFWYEFYTGLGPEGLLALNGKLAVLVPDLRTAPLWDTQLAATIGGIQALMGGGLATATARHGSGGAHGHDPYRPGQYELDAAWLAGLAAAGRRTFGIGGAGTAVPEGFRVYGYQLLGPLLNRGDYDSRFLSVVGGALVDFEMSAGGSRLWPVPDLPSLVPGSSDPGPALRLDWSPLRWGAATPAGFDPMAGLVAAMERNPEGALELLHGRASGGVGGWVDGTPKDEARPDLGVPPPPGGYRLPRLDYLLTDREWPPDWVRTTANILTATEGGVTDRSMALRQFGDVLVDVSRLRDERAVEVVEMLVYEVATDERAVGYQDGAVPGEGPALPSVDRDMLHPQLREPLAAVMADYIVDVNRGVHEQNVSIPGGRGAEFERTHLIRFLADLGKDRAAHVAVGEAEAAFAATSYRYYLSGDADLEHDSPVERRTAAADVASQYGVVAGALDKGAEEAAWLDQWRQDAARNAPAEAGLAVADQLVGLAAAVTDTRVPGAGYVGEQLIDAVLAEVRGTTVVDNSGMVTYGVAELMGGSREAAADLAMAAVYRSAELEKLDEFGLVDEDGKPKPMTGWEAADRHAWERYLGESGRAYARLGTEAAEAYDAGVREAGRILDGGE